MPFGTTYIEQMADFILWYAKQKTFPDGKPCAKYRQLYVPLEIEGEFHHCWYEMPEGQRYRMTADQMRNHSLLPKDAKVYRLKALEPSGRMEAGMFTQEFEGRNYKHPKNGYGTTPEGMQRLIHQLRVQSEGERLTFVMFANEGSASALTAPWYDTVGADGKVYVVQTNTKVFERCVLMTTDPGDIVLDPTCGSGTTATVAEQWGRRWITIDSSRVALALARTRLMAAKYPAYLLADSPEGQAKEAEITGKVQPDTVPLHDVRKGFVYERVPRVTLKSIANNEEIDAIHARWQEKLEPLRAELNAARGSAWEPWQIPRDAGEDWPDAAKTLLADYWKLWIARKKEMDASIARRAETVYLYDKPCENGKAVRVCGPFTVESISPHRVVAPDEEAARPETEQRAAVASQGDYEQTLLENLKRAGVGNTKKGEKIEFERLDTFGGLWLHAEGIQKETGTRIAVSLGPQFGTVSAEQVREAVKEARKRFESLVICGFAFDPAVYEETQTDSELFVRQFGKLTVMLARINQDLMVGGNLLKKTGAGNLFMVFGEPDIQIRRIAGQIQVEIFGLDIYDPTTGEIRSSSVDDLACWFVDTAYNGEAFLVRHAYFTGGDDPYERLRKTLRADIDEAAWSALYSTVSRPFDPPETGKIAVKVINHYGDEALRVYDLAKEAD